MSVQSNTFVEKLYYFCGTCLDRQVPDMDLNGESLCNTCNPQTSKICCA